MSMAEVGANDFAVQPITAHTQLEVSAAVISAITVGNAAGVMPGYALPPAPLLRKATTLEISEMTLKPNRRENVIYFRVVLRLTT
jgi:hypothetical protein